MQKQKEQSQQQKGNNKERKQNIKKIRESYKKLGLIKKESIRNSIMSPCSRSSSKEHHNFSLNKQDSNDFQENYQLLQKIGEGANAYVKRCRSKINGKIYAVKIIRLDQEQAIYLRANFRNITILRHQNIIRYKLLHLNRKKDTCHLVMEYFDGKPLSYNPPKNQNTLKIIFNKIFMALAYMHKKHICHRDLKPDNILYDPFTKQVKIVDFGISRKIQNRKGKRQMITPTGTLFYRAPQIILGGGYNNSVDVWSIGITLYQIIAGYTPFGSEYINQTLHNIQKCQLTFDQKIWNNFSFLVKDLITRILKRDERLTAQQALNHLWFNHSQMPQNDSSQQSQHNSMRLSQNKEALVKSLSKTGVGKPELLRKKTQQPKIQFMESDYQIIDNVDK